MRSSLLTTLIAIQVVAWCILGTYVHGWQILCYPAAWLAIGGGFFALNRYHDARHSSVESGEARMQGHRANEIKRPIDRSTKATASAN